MKENVGNEIGAHVAKAGHSEPLGGESGVKSPVPASSAPPPGTDLATDPENKSLRIDAPDESTPVPSAATNLTTQGQVPSSKTPPVPVVLDDMGASLVLDGYRNVYGVWRGHGNPTLMKLGSPEFNSVIRTAFLQRGLRLNRRQLADVNDELRTLAESSGLRTDVWRRVAPRPGGGIVIAAYDDTNTHIHVSPGMVEVLAEGSDVLFYRPPTAGAITLPAAAGDYKLLRKYLNLDAVGFTLYIAWVTYTLAHPKVKGSNFVILVFIGGEGTGKSHLTKVTI